MTKAVQRDAVARRDNAVSMAMKRKEEYLGARVPKELRDRVLQRAKEMGLPVSILMRNILEEAFKDGSAIDVKNESKEVAPLVITLGERFDSVLGWERIVLNKSVPCTCCGVQLPAGKNVILGVGAALPVILCDACKSGI